MVEFRLLGELEVLRDGVSLELGAHRQRALLALLLLHANTVLPTERLIAELWGESPPRTAPTALHNAISHLRKLLGPELLETRAPGYVLRVEPGQLDLARFEGAVRQARGHGAPERARLLREALDLWRGPALADLPYESFVQGEARRLDELRMTALEDRIEADLETGAHVDLVAELDALVALHPHRERLRAQQMLALYRCGRQAHALDAYGQARRLLADELGIEPSPTLRQLHGAILRQEAGLESSNGGRPAAANGAADDISEVVEALLAGRVVPVLGSDSGALATRLAERFQYPRAEAVDLTRVSQYVAVMRGLGPLYDELHALHEADCEPTSLHRFFAALPPLLRERGSPHQLLVTTACSDGLERALAAAGEEVDVVSYIAAGKARGKFSHRSPDGSVRVIDVPNTYAAELSLERRTIVLKLHGQLDATPSREWESFVVTEDDYIDYLGRADVDSAVPVGLAATLRRSHFLFLGYGMHDWNLRVVLGRMWGDRPVGYRSWAVHPQPKPIERELWRRVEVDLVELEIDAYVEALGVQAGLEPVAAA